MVLQKDCCGHITKKCWLIWILQSPFKNLNFRVVESQINQYITIADN